MIPLKFTNLHPELLTLKLMRQHFLIACFILLSIFSKAQDKISALHSEEWLKMITHNAISKAADGHSFLKAPRGFALYFSKAGSINVPYLVYVPKSYDPSKQMPAVVFLHGAILARDSFQYKSAEIANEPVFSAADMLNTIIIFPFARQDFKWSGQEAAYDNIINIIGQVEEHYNINKERVFIGGISMGGNATFWFINNKPDMFAGFYTFSAMPGTTTKFSNLTKEKPLYSMNAMDDPVFPYTEVAATYQKYKNEAPGWHFATIENGGHRFIYTKDGAKYIRSILGNLLQKKMQ